MYIDEEVMKGYLGSEEKFKALCKQKEKINKRFKFVAEELQEAMNIDQDTLNRPNFPLAQWDNEQKKIVEETEITREIFAPKEIGLTEGYRYDGVIKQTEYFNVLYPETKIGQIAKNILSIVGGFSNGKVIQEYRIIGNYPSNANSPQNSDYSSAIIGRYSESQKMPQDWITAHFADNTLFLDFISFMIAVQDKSEIKPDSYQNIALCYPEGKEGKGKISKRDEQTEIQTQREVLSHRFPLKFLWMWANQDTVIHPLSLMAFREFLKSDFMNEIFKDLSKDLEFQQYIWNEESQMGEEIAKYAESITNAKIERFPGLWSEVSNAIMNKLYGANWEKEGKKKKETKLKEVSLLISLLTLGETDMTNIDELLKTHKQIILYGVPGTGKTHSAKELIRKWSQEKFEDVEKSKRDQDEIDRLQLSKLLLDSENSKNKQDGGKKIERDINIVWEIMQFHPNTTYQDFIGGIIPKTEEDKSLTYEVESGKFKKFCEYASANPKIPFVFIIDEINRANLSEVLGELLYALEYRDEGITIPNFKEPFVIPSNVYIIGTMNNVDKSLSTFDLALRRRFGFYEIGVDCDVIKEMLDGKVEKDCLEKYIARCQDLNALISGDFDGEDEERLSKEENNTLKLEKHYKIGQAYFAKIEKFLQSGEAINPNHLRKLWDYHLQPLIEEYIGFSMGNQEISNKLDNLNAFWIRELK